MKQSMEHTSADEDWKTINSNSAFVFSSRFTAGLVLFAGAITALKQIHSLCACQQIYPLFIDIIGFM